MDIKTHLTINSRLCGTIELLENNKSTVTLLCTDEMSVDKHGLVHGGFVFGLADYAAMAAVNHPNVVLASTTGRFKKPVRVGETLTADARVVEEDGRKRNVQVKVVSGDETVFTGVFSCAVLDTHVLDKE
ncbi:MAG TPA: PaaI family thioesterase [Spirochaetes bacterium]|nr:PaaI family thioesterase [Spirochaetota bacterium]